MTVARASGAMPGYNVTVAGADGAMAGAHVMMAGAGVTSAGADVRNCHSASVIRKKPRGAAAWLSLVLLVSSGCVSNSSSVGFATGLPKVAASAEVQRQEHAMFEFLNQDRKAQGLPPLAYDERLADVARVHSADMRDNKFFAHESPTTGSLDDRLNAEGYLFLTARENLAEAPDPQQGQQNLMNSPPHHANIMASDVTHVGIGIVEGGVVDPRNLTFTQVFASPGLEENTSDARAAITASIENARSTGGVGAAEVHPALQEFAEAHVADLGDDAERSRVQEVSDQLAEQLGSLDGVRNVVVSGQLLPDSSAFRAPPILLQSPSAVYGLAVNRVAGEAGRPMLVVLALVGER